tara:strand:+ start:1601 stop:1933 length:333 start_codon:yes stop_codon:yes gene_type:complete
MVDIQNLSSFKGGWLVGSFNPNIFKRENIEVGIHELKKGSKGDNHFHKKYTEYNLIISGLVYEPTIDRVLHKDEMFIYYPNELSKVIFLEDTKLLVIRDGSDPKDKYYVA